MKMCQNCLAEDFCRNLTFRKEFRMKHVRIALVALAAMLVMSAPAHALQAVGIHDKVTDGILMLVDQSGSMYMKHKATGVEKIEMAKQALVRLNAKTPLLGYQGAICALTPNAVVAPAGAWDRQAWYGTLNGIPNGGAIYGRLTPLGMGLDGVASMLGQLPGNTAMVLVSDGNENLGKMGVQALQALYAAYPSAVMHIVSVADKAEGLAVLKQMAALKSESLFVDARDIINTDESAKTFVSKAFYEPTIPAQDVQSLRSVYFHTAKYDITKATAERLDRLAEVLMTRPELKIFVEGFADVRGSIPYNNTLSENRAMAVKKYLASKGCNNEIIISKGRGETKEYPSYQLNRRVDIMVIWE